MRNVVVDCDELVCTTDIAWAYSWLKANSWKYQRAIHVVGIDMSKAFDTVDRRKLMAVIIYLEAAMWEVRTLDAGLYSHGGGQRYRWGESLTETKYADDVDFICMSLRILDELVSVIASRLQPWNLQVNEGKTEKITIQPGTRDQARFKKLG